MIILITGASHTGKTALAYIKNHFSDIRRYASVVENRGEDEDCTIETVLRDNAEILEQCQKYKVNFLLIDEEYQVNIDL